MRTAFLLVFALSLTVLATATATAAEDRLVLNDGREISGTYLGGDDQEVRFLYTNAELVVPRKRVQRIDFAAQAAPARPVTFISEVPPQQPATVVYQQAQPATVVYQQAPPTTVVYQSAPVRYVEVERPAPRWNVSVGWYAGPWLFSHRRHCGPSFGPAWGVGYSSWYNCR